MIHVYCEDVKVIFKCLDNSDINYLVFLSPLMFDSVTVNPNYTLINT